jgi:hypothetical protein
MPEGSSFKIDSDICLQLPFNYNIKIKINANVLLSSCQGFQPHKKLHFGTALVVLCM